MTTEITILLKDKAITASDGAVTINNNKTWYGVKKTFTLSKNPPMNIMINGSPTINNFPLTLLIHEFEKISKSTNIEDMTEEFLEYIGKTVPKTDVKNFIYDKIDEFKNIYGKISKSEYIEYIEELSKIDIEIPEFIGNNYDLMFEEIIPNNISEKQKNKLKLSLKKIFIQYLITFSTGIVITGVNISNHFPSYIAFNILLNNNGKIEIINKKSEINCNKTIFEVFGQTDVIDAYLTGIDETFENKIIHLIEIIIKPSKLESNLLKSEIKRLKNTHKRNMLKNIESLPPNDLCDLMENLIKSTEIKKKLMSDIDNVGGDICINEITKYHGIQEKR